MTRSSIAFTTADDASAAGADLAEKILAGLDNEAPHAVILFASSRYDYEQLLSSLNEASTPGVLVGCSSAGEFITGQQGIGAACAIALVSDEMRFAAGLGRGVSEDRSAVARDITSGFRGIQSSGGEFRSALLLTDALAGYVDDLVEKLNIATAATYRIFGGGAGDDANFSRTHVFFGTRAYTDAAVALEILSSKPVGIGVSHGWQPAGGHMRVTESDGMRLISIDAMPAVEAFEEHAERTGQKFDRAAPLPFFLHNVVGIDTPAGYKLRVPLSVNEDGSISCAAEIPTGAIVSIMKSSVASAADATSTAIESAIEQVGENRPAVAIFFDCVATRLRLGREFGLELDVLESKIDPTKYAGCNTYGQIARTDGQFSGFHNCTATVCILPE